MALKPGPAVKAQVTVKKTAKKLPATITLDEVTGDFPIPDGYKTVETKDFKVVGATYPHIELKSKPGYSMIEVGVGAAPPNMVDKCFYLSSMYEWKLVKKWSSMILIPLEKK